MRNRASVASRPRPSSTFSTQRRAFSGSCPAPVATDDTHEWIVGSLISGRRSLPSRRNLYPIATILLRGIQRCVRSLHETLQGLACLRDGHTDGKGHLPDLPLRRGPLYSTVRNSRADLFCQRGGTLCGCVRQNHRKLLAAQARSHVASLDVRFQNMRHGAQDLVTEEVPV